MLRLVDDEGQLTEIDAELGSHLEHIAELERQLKDIERERRSERAKYRNLLNQIANARTTYARRDEVQDIFDEWRELCGHERARLTNDRFDAIRSLLEVDTPEPYPRAAFTVALMGAQFDSYSNTRRNGSIARFDDIELICRSGKHFEEFIRRAPPDALELRGLIARPEPEPKPTGLDPDVLTKEWDE